MRPFPAAAIALGFVAALSACARPGNTPEGMPAASSEVTFQAGVHGAQPVGSPGPGAVVAIPGIPGVLCDGSRAPAPQRVTSPPPKPRTAPQRVTSPPPKPWPDAGTSADPDAVADARERARRVLEAANPPIPRRGPLSPAAAARAEACVRVISPELTLLVHSPGWPDDQLLRKMLSDAGLTGIVVGSDSNFAAAAGDGCVHGTFGTDGPALSIGPQAPDGSCHL